MDDKEKIRITIDTTSGPIEKEVYVEDLSADKLFELIRLGMTWLYPHYEERVKRDKAGIKHYWPDGAPVFKIRRNEGASLFCILDQKLDSVVAFLMPLDSENFLTRSAGAWTYLHKSSPSIEEYCFSPAYRAFQIDWSVDPITDADPADENAWEHQLVQAWDQGRALTISEVGHYAFEVDPEELVEL